MPLSANQKKGAKLRRFLASTKLTAGCIDCGYNEHPDALEFDHVEMIRSDKTKKVMWVKSWAGVIAALEACVIRCANCHAIRSNAQRRELLCP